jgi:hypothetical protein
MGPIVIVDVLEGICLTTRVTIGSPSGFLIILLRFSEVHIVTVINFLSTSVGSKQVILTVTTRANPYTAGG